MKTLRDHYAAKYPGGHVHYDENVLHVRCAGGHDRVRIEKTGAGILRDVSAEHGCVDDHSGAPARTKDTKTGKWSERHVPVGEGKETKFVPISHARYCTGAKTYVLKDDAPKGE